MRKILMVFLLAGCGPRYLADGPGNIPNVHPPAIVDVANVDKEWCDWAGGKFNPINVICEDIDL